MSQVFHMDSNLVRSPRFQLALHQRDWAQTLQDMVVRNGMLTFFPIGEYRLNFSVAPIASNVTLNGAIKELHAERSHSLFCFTQYHDASCVLVQAVHQTRTRNGH